MEMEHMGESEDRKLRILNISIVLLIICHLACLVISSTQYDKHRNGIVFYFTGSLAGEPDTTMLYYLYSEFRKPFTIDSLIIICTILLLSILLIKGYNQWRKSSTIFLLVVYSFLFVIHVVPDVIFEFSGSTSILTGVRFLLGTSTDISRVKNLFILYYGLLMAAAVWFAISAFFTSRRPQI